MKKIFCVIISVLSIGAFAGNTIREGEFVKGTIRTTTDNQSINKALYELVVNNDDSKQLWSNDSGRAFELETSSQHIVCSMRWSNHAKPDVDTRNYSCSINKDI